MAISTGAGTFLQNYVDPKRGLASRELFVNEEFYQMEQERIFARVWLFIGHESQVEKPGDYFVARMGEESVILSRDRDNTIHVFLNSCRHRGMKVCRYDEGNTPVFTCPYHGWSYAGDGSLVGVPRYKDAYREELDKSQWGLVEVAQLANYKGTIWATWDPKAPSFLDYLGGMKTYLETFVDARDGSEGGSEVIVGVQKWLTPANWKFGAENRAGDGYHNTSHRSVDLVGIGVSRGQGRRDTNYSAGKTRGFSASFPESGHSMMATEQLEDLPWPPSFQHDKVVAEYAEHAYYERQRRLGTGARLVLAGGGNVFPNMSFWNQQPRRIGLWQPAGSAQRSEYWSWVFVDKDAPQEAKDMMRHYGMRYAGPLGMTEQDDMENWNYASKASKGTIAKRYPYNYGVALGHANKSDHMPGVITEGTTEQNQLGMYSFWAELMDAGSWDEIYENRERRAKS